MTIADYFLMRTPPLRLAATKGAPPGQLSTVRIVISIVGLLFGIFLSFIVTGLDAHPKAPAQQSQVTASATSSQDTPRPQLTLDLSWQRLLSVGLITLVICCLTYQGLYFSLRLYENEPAFLLFFIAFQYGYFWQSAVEGARVVLAGTTGVGG
jgi:hypothetical protein